MPAQHLQVCLQRPGAGELGGGEEGRGEGSGQHCFSSVGRRCSGFKNTGFRTPRPGLGSGSSTFFCEVLGNLLTSLKLSFLICKIVPTLRVNVSID